MTEFNLHTQDGRDDFDFLIGRWHDHHRRLKERLKGSTAWEEFEGTTVHRKLLGGLSNVSEHIMDRSSGRVEAVSFRFFDPRLQEWNIYWADSIRNTLDIPMIGRFKQGRGEFYAHEVFERRHIFCPFLLFLSKWLAGALPLPTISNRSSRGVKAHCVRLHASRTSV